ncbi:hypothetical protein O181_083348 [Austropuccinia psidii MF-1]|uniref:Uncharacterized protein n=1 Tax=Austropuccinia psidii MF-1 TaxID=1389203 RepID=A0A9Q3FP75_9BASI|nr:hypothetical protein [Austropuccinia psidii MF-1]
MVANVAEYCKTCDRCQKANDITTMSFALLLYGCGNPTWCQVGANWSRHIFYGQLAPLGVLWLLRHNPSQWPFLASGHILPSLASLANFHITNPQAFVFYFGPGGPFVF